jgi:hypothetical protein
MFPKHGHLKINQKIKMILKRKKEKRKKKIRGMRKSPIKM